MYLVIEVDSDIEVLVFNWVFEYEVLFDIRDLDMWHLILYVSDEEWVNLPLPAARIELGDVYYFELVRGNDFQSL